MNVLLLCVLLAQTLTGSSELPPGTEVTLAAPELVPVYGKAVLEHHQLVFSVSLEPETEVRVLIILPGKQTAEAPYGRIGPTGDDIYVKFEGSSKAVSFRKWLADEYGVDLVFPSAGTSPGN